jgi:tetratricopeptide (TPR) repeat protein
VKGRYDEALASCDEGTKLHVSAASECIRASIEAARGNQEIARELLARLEERWRNGPFETVLLAALACKIDEHEKAIAYLQEGYRREDGSVLTAPTYPTFDVLRGYPEYGKFLGSLGLKA